MIADIFITYSRASRKRYLEEMKRAEEALAREDWKAVRPDEQPSPETIEKIRKHHFKLWIQHLAQTRVWRYLIGNETLVRYVSFAVIMLNLFPGSFIWGTLWLSLNGWPEGSPAVMFNSVLLLGFVMLFPGLALGLLFGKLLNDIFDYIDFGYLHPKRKARIMLSGNRQGRWILKTIH